MIFEFSTFSCIFGGTSHLKVVMDVVSKAVGSMLGTVEEVSSEMARDGI